MRTLFLILISFSISFGQALTWDPLFPTDNDTITITYNAKEGNKALEGVSPIWAHTGVITDKSPNPNYWLYTIAEWETNLPKAQMTNIGTDSWQIRFHVRSFYGVPAGETIQNLALVFRNASGTKVGKTADNQDFFIPIYQQGVNISLVSPTTNTFIAKIGDEIPIITKTTSAVKQELFLNNQLLTETTDDSLYYLFTPQDYGFYQFTAIATDAQNNTKQTEFTIVVNTPVNIVELPSGVRDGINHNGINSVTLVLTAPFKEFVYVIGSFNNWEMDQDYYMNKTPDGTRYWLEIDGLDSDTEYTFQYLVDGSIRIADPYSGKILDPTHDKYITDETYPDLEPYPLGETTEAITAFKINQDEFTFTASDYEKPKMNNLVIYELLIRDFIEEHDYKTLTDSLAYFKRLGINAIELMPINEFEGNESWGYNPSFYFAPDKYYGPANDLKTFIDEAHKLGIAIIQDIVLNHAYGQCPWVRLYADQMDNNPWFNEKSPNTSYAWGYDFNHESEYTKAFVDSVLTYWLTEFKVDGFRFDFTKGLTNTPGDGWEYDPARITILKRIADHAWSVDSTAYIILEHFAANSEEKELSAYGMMLWGNMNTPYTQSAMGYTNDSNISGISASYRGWSDNHLVGYMESHDEERMMYKNLQWGNSAGTYHIYDLQTALERVQLSAAFFLTVPGPKMIWQFGELGYDYSIDYNDRVGNKPIRWDYYQDPDRRQLYDVFAALAHFRKLKAFQEGSFNLNLGTFLRTVRISHDSMNTVIVGNFNVTDSYIIPNFQHTGMWYDYLDGNQLDVSQTQQAILLQPSEFHIFTDVQLEKPFITNINENELAPISFILYDNHPNPFNASTRIDFELAKSDHVSLDVFNITGQHIITLVNSQLEQGRHSYVWNGKDAQNHTMSTGIYFYVITSSTTQHSKKMLLLK